MGLWRGFLYYSIRLYFSYSYSAVPFHRLRPHKVFAAAWTAAGYFERDHYPDFPDMSHANALATLDPSGMLRCCGVLNDIVEVPPTSRLLWAVVLDDGGQAYLPLAIGVAVERLICQHRRDRKLLADKKPAKWEAKLHQVNTRQMNVHYDKKKRQIATPKQVKNQSKFLEVLTIIMELQDSTMPGGPGTYFIFGEHYSKKKLVLLNAKDSVSGLEMLQDAYNGGPGATGFGQGENVGPMSCDVGPLYTKCALYTIYT